MVLTEFVKITALATVLLITSGCANNSWHCESDLSGVVDACSRVQTAVMRSIPPVCKTGADANVKMTAKSRESGFVRRRDEASIECKTQE